MNVQSRSIIAAAAILLTSGALALPASGAEWTFEKIGRGIKPAIAIDASDTPHVAFLTELMDGAVFQATLGSDGWQTVTMANGYFYGHVDIDVDRGRTLLYRLSRPRGEELPPRARLGSGGLRPRRGMGIGQDRGPGTRPVGHRYRRRGRWHLAPGRHRSPTVRFGRRARICNQRLRRGKGRTGRERPASL